MLYLPEYDHHRFFAVMRRGRRFGLYFLSCRCRCRLRCFNFFDSRRRLFSLYFSGCRCRRSIMLYLPEYDHHRLFAVMRRGRRFGLYFLYCRCRSSLFRLCLFEDQKLRLRFRSRECIKIQIFRIHFRRLSRRSRLFLLACRSKSVKVFVDIRCRLRLHCDVSRSLIKLYVCPGQLHEPLAESFDLIFLISRSCYCHARL